MAKWMGVCRDSELVEGEIKSFKLNDTRILLARWNDKVYALEDLCSHDGAELSDGDLVDGEIQCARHGARFDLESGNATRMPAIVGISKFNVEIRDTEIFIEAIC